MNTFSTIGLYLAAVIGAASIADAATDYCDKSLCFGGTHIACNHTGQFGNLCPLDATLVTITTELQEFLLKLINEKRNFVAGGNVAKHRPACRMSTMQWDEELAKLAELNVKQCEMNDNECHNTKSFPRSGQNLAYGTFFTNTADDKQMLGGLVEMWYDEIKHSRMRIINSFPGDSSKHISNFINLVVESNNSVGCAAATYSVEGEENKIYLVACNMATTPMENRRVYKSCQISGYKCKTGTNSQYPNLCKTSEKYKLLK